jgi:ABC-type sugar transport system permease subunit
VSTSLAAPRAAPRSRPARQTRPGIVYALPAFVFFSLFAVLPMLLVVYLSFTDWTGFGTPTVSGVGNWTRLVGDPEAWSALGRSLLFTALAWAFQTPVALLLGVWAAGPQRSRAVLSSIFFIPLLISTTAIALLFTRIFEPNFGLTRELPLIGDINFLGPGWALYTLVFVVSWQFIPFHTLLYQAAARSLPTDIYEAARIDGAGRVQRFFRITLPLLRYTIATSTVLILVGSMTAFETVLILTNGGPGTETRILPLYMYEIGFRRFEFGYGAAIAVVLLVLGAALSLAVTRLSGFRSDASQVEGA